jgi:HEAT repeat protein
MTTSKSSQAPGELVAQLGTAAPNDQAKALAALVMMGAAATPALLAAFPTAPATMRAQIAQAFAEIADPSTVDTLAGLLGDADPLVRGRGAQGLARLNDPRALDALALTLDDLPDLLHWPYTVAVSLLIERGEAVLPTVEKLLDAPDAVTRTRAFQVLRDVLTRARGEAAWQALVARLGALDPYGADPGNPAVAARWRVWLADGGAEAPKI